jgi:hypothetical protein
VDKDSPGLYWRKLLTAWAGQAAIIGVLFAGILVAMARKKQKQ